MSQLKAAILIVSETAAKDPSTDRCGGVLKDVFGRDGARQWHVHALDIVPDSVLDVQRFVQRWADAGDAVNLIVTSGGTGFTPKDITPEAVGPLIHKHAPGIVHGMLAASLQVTPFAMMARPVAGVRNKTLIVTLPGSPKGAKENLEAVIKLLPHACIQAAGADSRTLHAGGLQKLENDAGLHDSSEPAGAKPGHHHHHHHHAHGHGHEQGHGGHAVPRVHTNPDDHPQSNDPSLGPTRRYRQSPYEMLSVEQALDQIAQHTPKPTVVVIPLGEKAVGHVLAEDIKAPESVPAFRASIVDGYAVRIPEGGSFKEGVYPVALVSHAQAGEIPPLEEGKIARITTGAPLPPHASAVVMVEDTALDSMTDDGKEEKDVKILTSAIEPNENVREVGSDVQAGDVIMKAGEGITAVGGELGLLASVGVREIKVFRKPVVGVLSTGDEIVEFDRPGELRLGEVRDTNRPTLLNAVRSSGFEAVDLRIASDQPGSLEETLRLALRQVDVIITSGGVSMGELDLLKPTIERQLGGTIHFGRVSMKPGKPTTFATVPFKSAGGGDHGGGTRASIFSLPGNPASAVTTFQLFVLPALHRASGISPPGLPRVRVRIDAPDGLRCDGKRAEYHRALVVTRADGGLHASSTGGQRSSRIGSFKGANALLCLPVKDGFVKRGETVDALIMGPVISEL